MKDFKKPMALPGTKVYAHNYRKKVKNDNGDMVDAGEWEQGVVSRVETTWSKDGTYSHKYTVTLDRKTKPRYKDWHRCIRLYLSEDGISI